jgi:hypothetical protein
MVHLAVDGQILCDTTVPDVAVRIQNFFELQASSVVSPRNRELFQIYSLLHETIIVALEEAT